VLIARIDPGMEGEEINDHDDDEGADEHEQRVH
jgi:hypothetical protein